MSPGALPPRGSGFPVGVSFPQILGIAQSPQSSPRWSPAFKMEPVLFPPSVKTVLLLQGALVLSLVRELRCHTPCGLTKKKKKRIDLKFHIQGGVQYQWINNQWRIPSPLIQLARNFGGPPVLIPARGPSQHCSFESGQHSVFSLHAQLGRHDLPGAPEAKALGCESPGIHESTLTRGFQLPLPRSWEDRAQKWVQTWDAGGHRAS